MGVFEIPAFAAGTREMGEAVEIDGLLPDGAFTEITNAYPELAVSLVTEGERREGPVRVERLLQRLRQLPLRIRNVPTRDGRLAGVDTGRCRCCGASSRPKALRRTRHPVRLRRGRRQQFLAEIEQCPVMHPSVGTRLMALSEMIGGLTIKSRVPQIEVAIGDDQCVLAVRVLDPPTDEDKAKMRAFAEANDIVLYLQPKGPDSIVPLWPEHPVLPTYALPEHDITFQFKPTMFTQVNTEINRKMIDRVLEVLDLDEQDSVLDLFCGLGNFTLPMAKLAGHVVGIEGDQPLVKHARANARMNHIDNVEFFAVDLTGDIDDMAWARQRYNKILLDPSRAGAAEVLSLFPKWHPERIVYVSCNPSTLARDAGILVNDLGYQLIKAGVMDMFPQTAHVESIALFEK